MKHPPPRALKTKRRKLDPPGPSLIAQLPPGVWKIPPCRWVLSLRKHDGEKEIRTVRGNLTEVRTRRDTLMATGRYTMAWLIESREDIRKRGVQRRTPLEDGG